MADNEEVTKAAVSQSPRGAFGEAGVTGLQVYGGVVSEEFLPQLKGNRAVRTYREMADNNSTIGAILFAIDLLVRNTQWSVEAADDTPEAEQAKEFLESVNDDMSHTWEDFVSESLTMLTYGWSYFEHVFKRRLGPAQRDPTKRSKYSDGLIGIRKLAPRMQPTLDRWEMQGDGGIDGWWQIPPQGTTAQIFLPIDKGLLFRTVTRGNNPEGRSILRTSYVDFFRLKQIQSYEAVGIERELAGLPVLYAPNDLMEQAAAGNAAAVTALAAYKKMVRDVRLNEQGGAIIPSDVYEDDEGKPSSQQKFRLELLSSGGQRSIDPDKTIRRYEASIARSVLADFLMLGSDGKGSYSLSENKTTLFLTAIETFNEIIASTYNRHMIPRLWDRNGFDRATMPQMRPGTVKPTDLDALGAYIERLSRAGFTVGADEALEDHLRDEGGLPAAERGPGLLDDVSGG